MSFFLSSLAAAGEVGRYSGSLDISSGQGNIIISGPGETPQHYCGNDILETYIGEQCDGTDLGGETCVSLGYDSGSLACKQDCIFDTSGCEVEAEGGSEGTGGGGGSGGGGKKTCVENWVCTVWSVCGEDDLQTRSCVDSNKCGTQKIKPKETRECVKIASGESEGESGQAGIGEAGSEQVESGQGWSITGAFLGVGSPVFGFGIVILIVLLFLALFLLLRQKGKK